MNTHILSPKKIMVIGFMLFALFLGAGNMIFPPFLGQESGTHAWLATIGFLITGVSLPLIGVIAIAKSGGDLQDLASRVHPLFGLIFTVVIYLTIGPFFGIPRTGTVSYEISVAPFLPESWSHSGISLFFYTIVFFGLTAWLSLNPSKLVDRIGKYLTPALFMILAVIVVKSLLFPLGHAQEPHGDYVTKPFSTGFLQGYQTMDTLGSLVFGILIISSIKSQGTSDPKVITKACTYAGMIAASGLVLVYLSLSYIGVTSVSTIGHQDNGGSILSAAASALYGQFGAMFLGLAIFFACLTTSIGLITSCAQFFTKWIHNIPYKVFVILFSVFSMLIANVGLNALLKFSLPALVVIYPLAIVLIALSFFHNFFKGYSSVYIGALIPTVIISIIDGLKAANIVFPILDHNLQYLPLYTSGIGWVLPSFIGALVGLLVALSLRQKTNQISFNK